MKEISGYTAKQQSAIMLNANELYKNLDQQILQEILQEIAELPFHRYPDETSAELIQAYADVCKFPMSQILAGNGSDEMLGLLIGSFLGKGKTLYTLSPDFSMYDYYAGMHEANVYTFPCERDGNLQIESFIECGREKRIDMILFSNPNNPTGHFLTNQQLCEVVEAFPGIPVIIDEAYGEFAKESMLSYINTYENLYVTRTLSKAYGLAGARLGFVISSTNNIAKLRSCMVPYNISSITQKIGTVVLRHSAEYQDIIEEIKRARDEMYRKVECLDRITFYPSQANYLFARCEQKEELFSLFEKEGISIRNYQDDSLRITIGSMEENKKVYELLQIFDRTRKEATV